MFAVRAISGNRAVIVQLFNAPGTYQPLYGRTVFQLEGQGSPGNSGYEDLIGTNPTEWTAVATYFRYPTPNQPGDSASVNSSGSSPGCPPNDFASDPVGETFIQYSCTPGNEIFSFVPGNPGTPANVLGVTLPGGPGDDVAPVVPYTPVVIPTTGVSITVPPGGFVRIRSL